MKFFAQLAILLALGAAVPVSAQVGSALPKNDPIRNKAAKDKTGNDKAGKALIADAVIDRLLAMTPQERAQALQRLPLPRRRMALQTLQLLELLSPEERTVLRGRYQLLVGLPPGRQRAVRQELRELRALTRPERRRRLASDDLRSRFSEQELQLLYEAVGLPEP